MIPRFKPNYKLSDLRYAFMASRSDSITAFEHAFARAANQKHAIAFPYGRTAIIFLLQALGLKDKEIICPAYTCVVVAHAIKMSGNIPVFIDCATDDFNMDLQQVKHYINHSTGAIMATSLFGYPVDLDKLAELRDAFPEVYIIQDCAHSFFTEYQQAFVHQYGVAAVYGLNVSKIINSIYGGVISTDSDKLAQALRELKKQKISKWTLGKNLQRRIFFLASYFAFSKIGYFITYLCKRLGLLSGYDKYYDETKITMPKDYLIDICPVEALVGLSQLKKYDVIIKHRKKIFNYYIAELNQVANIKLPPAINGATYSHCVVLVKNRDNFMNAMALEGVELGFVLEYSIPRMSIYHDSLGNRARSYKNAENYADHVVNLPLTCSSKEARKVVAAVKKVLNDGQEESYCRY